MLYDLGARFIKNDYNRSVMLGAEIRGSSVGEGLKKSAEAFYALIDRVKKKHPGSEDRKLRAAVRCEATTDAASF